MGREVAVTLLSDKEVSNRKQVVGQSSCLVEYVNEFLMIRLYKPEI